LSWFLVLTAVCGLALAGCGGDDDDDGDKPGGGGGDITVDSFVGNWTQSEAKQTVMCGAIPLEVDAQPMTITKGAAANELTVTEGPCTLTFTVTGSTASATPGQTCTISQGIASGTVTLTSYTITLSDAKAGSKAGTGTVAVTSPLAMSCTYTASGKLTKS